MEYFTVTLERFIQAENAEDAKSMFIEWILSKPMTARDDVNVIADKSE